jgi:hypothetical protein
VYSYVLRLSVVKSTPWGVEEEGAGGKGRGTRLQG